MNLIQTIKNTKDRLSYFLLDKHIFMEDLLKIGILGYLALNSFQKAGNSLDLTKLDKINLPGTYEQFSLEEKLIDKEITKIKEYFATKKETIKEDKPKKIINIKPEKENTVFLLYSWYSGSKDADKRKVTHVSYLFNDSSETDPYVIELFGNVSRGNKRLGKIKKELASVDRIYKEVAIAEVNFPTKEMYLNFLIKAKKATERDQIYWNEFRCQAEECGGFIRKYPDRTDPDLRKAMKEQGKKVGPNFGKSWWWGDHAWNQYAKLYGMTYNGKTAESYGLEKEHENFRLIFDFEKDDFKKLDLVYNQIREHYSNSIKYNLQNNPLFKSAMEKANLIDKKLAYKKEKEREKNKLN